MKYVLNELCPISLKPNNVDFPLEINCKRITTVFFIHWSEGKPWPLLASSTSSFIWQPRQQLCGAEG
ncbi:unnamed protein product [Hymenolepis diminuta]|uniref:Uncharacterized protein n=1 Tax=Hymenolepis diminuta TaxID=6216 RepID=A0A564Y094_HYMDI|nr:unnamed protein product [Hymenolepis diminuta]